MPLAITLDDKATVAHAASMMALEGFHHVMVVGQSGVLIGVVSSQDVVRWIVENDGLVGRLNACESSAQDR
jgi:CBS domain-containing protein